MSDGEFRPLSGRGAKPAEQQPEIIGIDKAAPGSDQTVYVLTVPAGTVGCYIKRLKAEVADKFGADAKVLVLTDGIQLNVITKGRDHA